jgi:predicted nucleic acid-binding Zn ribbon protein
MSPDRSSTGPNRPPGPNSRGLRRAPATGDVVARVPRHAPDEDAFDENPSEADIERFSNVTRTCPACSKEVFDDAAICYHCGHAFERTAAGSSKTPVWVFVVIALLIAALVVPTVLGIF